MNVSLDHVDTKDEGYGLAVGLHAPTVTDVADDGGHDVIDNFEFPCNSMENLISI